MARKILPLVIIFVFTLIAWMILGSVTMGRTYSQDNKLKSRVGDLWGATQQQEAPEAYYRITVKTVKTKTVEGKKTEETVETTETHNLDIESSRINADFDLDYRKKGLLWYSTYKVKFKAVYCLINTDSQKRYVNFVYKFPASDGVYDNFAISIDGVKEKSIKPSGGKAVVGRYFEPGRKYYIEVAYDSQGLDRWWYNFGQGVTQVKDFALVMTTNFDRIDFPQNGISPTEKKKMEKGWELSWEYKNLLSGIRIGIEMPKKLNPGPFVSQISFFAPVSLFFFFFLMFIITTIKNVKIHPVNYFFVAAAFFSFHLLMAYLADVVSLYIAFAVSSAVSVFLVISYMRLVAGARFAVVEVGLAQLVYLVVFSSAFFLEGYTGLAITVLVIITLFVVMQVTGRVDWEKQFEKEKRLPEKSTHKPGRV